LIVAFFALLAYLLVPAYYFASADALVEGDLVPVTPIFRARIDRLMVQCDDRVHAGQKVAVVSNYLVQAEYEQQYQQSISELGLSQIALDQGGAAATTEESADLAKYQAADIEARRLHDVFTNYDAAYRAGGIPRVEWESKRQDWLAAVSTAEGLRQVWQHASEHVQRVNSDNQTRVASDARNSERQASLAKRVSAEALTAPVSGFVMNCKLRPDNVVDAGAPIFDIFSPLEHVHIGQHADVYVAGSKRPIDGRVVSVYPDLAKLPTQLTRFFWQHVQWSEYRPVRIALDHVAPAVRAQLYYDAQTRVRIPIPRDWHPFGLYDDANGKS
jgi:multidrug resistance efflux pump